MRSSIVRCEVRRQDAQQVVSARGSAALEEKPGGLQIIKWRDAFQQPVLVSALPLELARDEIFMTKRGTQHIESLTVWGEAPVADPNWLAATSGEVTDVRRLFASGIPNTRFALVQANSRTVPERCREKVVEFADAFW